MRRPYPIVLIIAAVAVFVLAGWWLAMISTATPASASDYCTSSYASIQDTIDAAGDGDTIKVVYGTHYENLDITDDITLEGGWSKGCPNPRTYTDPQYTIIDGSAADHVVEITGGSTVTLDGLTITNGHAQKGGGVYVDSASADLNYVIVTGNVISPTGGSSYLDWGYGGGVYIHSGTLTLNNCEISHNTRDQSSSYICVGGGLALESEGLDPAIAVIENTDIVSNTNHVDSDSFGSLLYGGGLYLDPQSQVTFEGTDNLIAYNEARAGGGVYMYGDVDLEGVLIPENTASVEGGGIFVSSGFNGGRIANNYIIGNRAIGVNRNGQSVVASDVDLEIANNTIVGDLTGSGAGIDVMDTGSGVVELTNNIVVSSTIGIRINGSASATLANNDVWDNTTDYSFVSPGSGDISVDPQFEDPDNGDYHLGSDSPCIDAGTYVEGLYFDYDRDRPTGRLLDIGADEYHMDPFFIPLCVKSYAP